MSSERLVFVWTILLGVALVASGIQPYDHLTWFLEVLPVMIVLPILWRTRRTFPLTSLLIHLIGIHGLILILGGTYTYSRVPLGFWLAELLGSDRNPYDKIGHFAQGFVPVIAAREILLRGGYLRRGAMTVYLLLSLVLAISAMYELIEWAAALAIGQGASEFLGTQGYEWDTQSDMFLALVGAILALLVLSRTHDRLIETLQGSPRR